MFGSNTLRKKILQRISPKIDEAVAEHEQTKAQLDNEFYDQVQNLSNAHKGRVERLEEDTISKF